MSTITSGTELRHIQNRAYCRYDTANAEKIVHALDKGNVPHFARYNQQALSLTYDSSFQAVVDEIIQKQNPVILRSCCLKYRTERMSTDAGFLYRKLLTYWRCLWVQ